MLQQLEKRAALRKEADVAAAEIMNAVEAPTLQEAEVLLEGTDRTTLEAELAVYRRAVSRIRIRGAVSYSVTIARRAML